jgi:hypothetical protein
MFHKTIKMIAFFMAITFSIKLDHQKSRPDSWYKKNGNKLPDEKGRKSTSPKNAEGCYEPYFTFYNALTTIDGRIHLSNSALKHQKLGISV